REKARLVSAELERLAKEWVRPENEHGVTAMEYLRRPGVGYRQATALASPAEPLAWEVAEQVEVEAKYAGYIAKARAEAERQARMEERVIPEDFDYSSIVPLRREARDVLTRFGPRTVGQAARLSGVTPADIALLLVHLRRMAGAQARTNERTASPATASECDCGDEERLATSDAGRDAL
ncbi:MAG: hypothetical protein M1370_04635, partial [Bacteroidetes bacterium]|nr:hypothetical protein [Bacteroidota bacterium]